MGSNIPEEGRITELDNHSGRKRRTEHGPEPGPEFRHFDGGWVSALCKFPSCPESKRRNFTT